MFPTLSLSKNIRIETLQNYWFEVGFRTLFVHNEDKNKK